MANNTIIDITDEDAADLQFPKDLLQQTVPTDKLESDIELDVSSRKKEILISGSMCHVCRSDLVEPYIQCAVCPHIEMCLFCFGNGREINEHKNDHDYIVIKNEFPLINNSNWSAKQELELLNVIQQCGFGNWSDIKYKMQGKSAEECKTHYLQNYIDNQTLPDLPKIKETKTSLFPCEIIPYVFKLQDVEDPPRFDMYAINKKLLAGYNAARSDFAVNFDNHAETVISELDFDEFQTHDNEYELGRALQVTLVKIYNSRLKERVRRQKIVREHGLITFRKIILGIQRFDNTITKSIANRLLVYMQLMNGITFDSFMEGLHCAGRQKNRIKKLLELRKNGIKYFDSVHVFEKLKKLREESERERKQCLNNPKYNWGTILPDSTILCNNVNPGSTQRKSAPPLDVKGLAGYEKLDADEIELCSITRVIPVNYLDFKHILIIENKKCGHLKLAQARILLKIDVNKTRKIYDFLIEKGYINKAP